MMNLRSKRSLPAGSGLHFGIDIDGTISQAPRHFCRLINALLDHGDKVYIVTARSEALRRETELLLRCMSIQYSELVMLPTDWAGTVAEFKVHVVEEKGISLMIDNNADNCWAIIEQTEALAAHMLPIPELLEAREAKERCGLDHGASDDQPVNPGSPTHPQRSSQ